MGLFDRKTERAADRIIERIEREEGGKGRYGNPIMVWVISAILSIVIKKLLERIIESDGADIKQMAQGLLDKIEEDDNNE